MRAEASLCRAVLRSSAKVELEAITRALEAKMSTRTLFSPV
jgi:hypothetical protein